MLHIAPSCLSLGNTFFWDGGAGYSLLRRLQVCAHIPLAPHSWPENCQLSGRQYNLPTHGFTERPTIGVAPQHF